MCISPLTIKRDYNRLASEVEAGYNTNTDIVPCGKCHECLGVRRNSWAFRLWKQMDVSDSAYFITLTYADEPLTKNGHGTLKKTDLQRFWKRLRKRSPGRRIKYYACGEYGGLYKRPHYHAIVYNIPQSLALDSENFAKSIWTHGQVDIAPANMPTIFYTVGYIMKGSWEPQHEIDTDTGLITCEDDRVPEYSTMSKNLGLNYLSEAIWNWHVDTMSSFVTMQNGSLMAMPRYYREKVFSREERKELAAEARFIRNLNWQEFANIDYNREHDKKVASVRKHKKEQQLKRMKL